MCIGFSRQPILAEGSPSHYRGKQLCPQQPPTRLLLHRQSPCGHIAQLLEALLQAGPGGLVAASHGGLGSAGQQVTGRWLTQW